MRALKISLILSLSLSATLLIAQDEKKPPALKVSDGYFTAGVLMSNTNPSAVADFRKLFPESSLLDQDFSEYESNTAHSFNRTLAYNAAMAIDFLGRSTGEYRENIQLRVGVGMTPVTGMGAYYSTENRFRFDTLNASRPLYVDSIYNRATAMGYSASNLNLDVSFLLRTSPENRWMLYAGLGVTGGVTLDAYVNVNRYSSSRLESTDADYNYFVHQSTASEREFKRIEAGMAGSIYFPFGIGYRLSSRHQFWRKVNLIAEGRPLLEWNNIPNLGAYTNTTFLASFGFRISS